MLVWEIFSMIIRHFISSDTNSCLNIFESNCPLYFDSSEFELFKRWLNHLSTKNSITSGNAYTNSIHDEYFVVDNERSEIIGCGGFYVIEESREARLAWGMIDRKHHNTGVGTHLFKHRIHVIKQNWKDYQITLGTSQHTYQFYERQGMKVVDFVPNGYGESLDRYDMEL